MDHKECMVASPHSPGHIVVHTAPMLCRLRHHLWMGKGHQEHQIQPQLVSRPPWPQYYWPFEASAQPQATFRYHAPQRQH
eukprot:UC1_evm3s1779